MPQRKASAFNWVQGSRFSFTLPLVKQPRGARVEIEMPRKVRELRFDVFLDLRAVAVGHFPAAHAGVGTDEGHVDHAVRDDVDPCRADPVGVDQQVEAPAGHHDEARGQRVEALHDVTLGRVGRSQHAVEGGDDRALQLLEEAEEVGARGPSVDAELVLNGNDLDVVDMEETGGPGV